MFWYGAARWAMARADARAAERAADTDPVLVVDRGGRILTVNQAASDFADALGVSTAPGAPVEVTDLVTISKTPAQIQALATTYLVADKALHLVVTPQPKPAGP